MTQDRSGWGERKKARAASDVWVSSTSTNQLVHGTHTSAASSSRSARLWKRSSSSTADGGEPAWMAFMATSASRREKAAYMEGR